MLVLGLGLLLAQCFGFLVDAITSLVTRMDWSLYGRALGFTFLKDILQQTIMLVLHIASFPRTLILRLSRLSIGLIFSFHSLTILTFLPTDIAASNSVERHFLYFS